MAASKRPKLGALAPRFPTMDSRTVPVAPKETDSHYGSAAHKDWARAVKVRAGWRCQHPGCSNGPPEHRLYADHVVELRDGGAPLDPANGKALCGKHHTLKTVQERAARLQT